MIVLSGNDKFYVKTCKTLFSQFRGLIFKRLNNDGLLFIFNKERKVDLHMLFVFYTIDILFIDSKLNVIKILKRIKPFTFYISGIKCRYILELKNCKHLKVGDKVSFKYQN